MERWLIVGLGNPGKKYESTRHNVGFMLVDALAERLGLVTGRQAFQGVLAQADRGAKHFSLLKPHTFMNLSGQSVGEAARYFKIPLECIVVVHDELDLPLGALRFKRGGGYAGHNGLRSIGDHLQSPDFIRLRVGVGRPPPGVKGAHYVLAPFSRSEVQCVQEVCARGVEATLHLADVGLPKATNILHALPHLGVEGAS